MVTSTDNISRVVPGRAFTIARVCPANELSKLGLADVGWAQDYHADPARQHGAVARCCPHRRYRRPNPPDTIE